MKRVNRTYLYWGVFLVALGGVVVAAELAGIDTEAIADAWRLWPMIVVAIGVALVLRRTRFGLAGGMLAAAVPGLALGSLIAAGPQLAVDCGSGEPSRYIERQGAFAGPARIDVTTGCGGLSITTRPGADWALEAGNTRDRSPRVDASAQHLSINRERGSGWFGFRGRDDWRLALPTAPIDDLSVIVNAGEGRVVLPGAQIGSLGFTTNAGRSILDLSGASLDSLSGTVNAGELLVSLPAGHDLAGSLAVNAGSARVCAPDGLGLRIEQDGALGSTAFQGLVQRGTAWQSPDYESAAHRADLSVSVNLGNLEFNPIGGCK